MIPNDYDLWLDRQRRQMPLPDLKAAIAAARSTYDRTILTRELNRRRRDDSAQH